MDRSEFPPTEEPASQRHAVHALNAPAKLEEEEEVEEEFMSGCMVPSHVAAGTINMSSTGSESQKGLDAACEVLETESKMPRPGYDYNYRASTTGTIAGAGLTLDRGLEANVCWTSGTLVLG